MPHPPPFWKCDSGRPHLSALPGGQLETWVIFDTIIQFSEHLPCLFRLVSCMGHFRITWDLTHRYKWFLSSFLFSASSPQSLIGTRKEGDGASAYICLVKAVDSLVELHSTVAAAVTPGGMVSHHLLLAFAQHKEWVDWAPVPRLQWMNSSGWGKERDTACMLQLCSWEGNCFFCLVRRASLFSVLWTKQVDFSWDIIFLLYPLGFCVAGRSAPGPRHTWETNPKNSSSTLPLVAQPSSCCHPSASSDSCSVWVQGLFVISPSRRRVDPA